MIRATEGEFSKNLGGTADVKQQSCMTLSTQNLGKYSITVYEGRAEFSVETVVWGHPSGSGFSTKVPVFSLRVEGLQPWFRVEV